MTHKVINAGSRIEVEIYKENGDIVFNLTKKSKGVVVTVHNFDKRQTMVVSDDNKAIVGNAADDGHVVVRGGAIFALSKMPSEMRPKDISEEPRYGGW